MFNQQSYVGFKIKPPLALNRKIYFTGSFTSILDNDTAINYTAGRVFSTDSSVGTPNPTFNNNVTVGANGVTQMSAVDPVSGKIYVCGAFTTYNGILSRGLVRLNKDGTIDKVYGTGFNSTVNYVYVTPDQRVLCVGVFTQYLGVGANRIVRINEDGTRDGTFNILGGLNNTGQSICADATHYYVCGDFTTYRGGNSGRIAKIDIVTALRVGTFVGLNLGFAQAVETFGNNIYITGDGFTQFNGAAVPTNMCKLDKTTTPMTIDATWNANMGTGFNGRASFFQIDDTGSDIYLSGSFGTLNGASVQRNIKLSTSGVLNATYITPNTATGNPRSSRINKDDNLIVITGDFDVVTTSAQRIMCVDPITGTRDVTWNFSSAGVCTNALIT
jgi:hypothetical protein